MNKSKLDSLIEDLRHQVDYTSGCMFGTEMNEAEYAAAMAEKKAAEWVLRLIEALREEQS